MVRRLLALGADVNGGKGGGKTPLMAAASCRSVEITELLLAAGADVNAKGSYGKTALSEALWGTEMHGPNPVVPILQAAGARK
jgi:ankyrin repeat protein